MLQFRAEAFDVFNRLPAILCSNRTVIPPVKIASSVYRSFMADLEGIGHHRRR